MAKVTYLSHSGFAVALDNVILVFDYDHDPAHALKHFLSQNEGKPVVFFVSHRHKDHFKPDIFEIAQNRKRLFVISNDVPAQLIPSNLDVAGMSHGDYIENLPGDISVKAFGTSGAGVSFMVIDKDGNTIFHAGDLNDWKGKGDHTKKEASKEHAKFETCVNRIASDYPQVDIAFFPVDVTLGEDFADGARYFMQKVKVDDFFPMHFNGNWREACDFSTYAPATTSCHALHEPGESINLNRQMQPATQH